MKRKILLSIALSMLYSIANADTQSDMSSVYEVYEANKSIVDSLLSTRVPEELIRIYHFYKVPSDSHKKLRYYVKQRELLLIYQDFINKDSLVKRVQNKIDIELCYLDSINTILIPTIGNHISGENLSYALHCKDILKLDNVQYDYIMEQALDMARRIRSDYRTNVWNEEMNILKKSLDKQQLQSFFMHKNARLVTNEFDKAWDRIKEAGLTEQLDSVNDAKDAVNYMFNRQMIKDIYRGYGTSQKKKLAELESNMPKMIRMLNGLDKKARLRDENKLISKEFIW